MWPNMQFPADLVLLTKKKSLTKNFIFGALITLGSTSTEHSTQMVQTIHAAKFGFFSFIFLVSWKILIFVSFIKNKKKTKTDP